MSERLKELGKEIDKQRKENDKLMKPLYEERNLLEEQKEADINKKLIGKYYKYKNSYGSGDTWWIYYKVIGLSELRSVKVLSVEESEHPKLDIQIGSLPIAMLEKEISKEEFEKTYKKAIKKLEEANKVK